MTRFINFKLDNNGIITINPEYIISFSKGFGIQTVLRISYIHKSEDITVNESHELVSKKLAGIYD